eukprot:TRINITY_DN12698_c1_g2_i1.p1 TRINITY_DN12698_c1_g2~~TRINITY_DN12698_c1_g2_i1.p1  ORF type:complete len:479 (+),score=100.88 TRINITY_DN12698_c1_g2_i1:346-1782(+)
MAAADTAAPAAVSGTEDAEVTRMLDEWVAARRARDFETADKLRAELRKRGVDANAARPPPASKARKPSSRNSILYPPAVGGETGVRVVITGGRCFRCPVRVAMGRGGQEDGMMHDGEIADVRFNPDTGHYELYLGDEVPPEYYKFIIGSKGTTLQQLEHDTGASIRVPKSDRDTDGIVLRGLNEAAVVDAKTRIEFLVERSRSKLGYTHFISLPLVDSIVEPCESLCERMKRMCSAQNRVEPSVFQNPRKLHLTLLMLKLYTAEALDKAVQCMRKCEPILRKLFSRADRIHLSGLNYMNDDPSAVDVLYISVAENETRDKILGLVEQVADVFIMAGLATSREVEHTEKLHATLLNSKWRKGTEEEQDDIEMPAPRGAPSEKGPESREGDWTCPNINCGASNFASRSKCHKCGARRGDEAKAKPQRRGQRVPFDITDLMQVHGDADLGHHNLRRLELSVLGPEVQENGYYKAVTSVHFP